MRLIWTDAGYAALVNAKNNGTNSVLCQYIAIGSGTTPASADDTALEEEIKRVDTIAGQAVDDNIIHAVMRDESKDAYAAYEVGLISDDNVLLARYAQADAILEKAAPSTGLLTVDSIFTDVDVTQVVFPSIEFVNPPWGEDTQGVVQKATDVIARALSDNTRGMTARLVKAAIQSFFNGAKGAGAENDLDSDRLDGQHGAYYRNASNLNAGTVPAARMSGAYPKADSGSVAGHKPQSSPTDVTQKIMLIGAFGLGGDAIYSAGTDANTLTKTGFYYVDGANRPPGANNGHLIVIQHSTDYVRQIFCSYSDDTIWTRHKQNSSWSGWVNDWNAGNDGSGSGLDADLLDGKQGSYYRNASNLNAGTVPAARLGADYTLPGKWAFGKAVVIGHGVVASSNTDLSKHLQVYGPNYGLNVTSSTLNIVAQNGGGIVDVQASSLRVKGNDVFNASNLNAGTMPSARMSGTYGISISGSAAKLGGYGIDSVPLISYPSSGVDVGSLVRGGMYYIPGSYTGAPGGYAYANMLSVKSPEGNSALQIIAKYNNSGLAWRCGALSSGSIASVAFKAIIDSDNIGSYLFKNVNDVTGSRSSGTTYTNSTGRPMLVTLDFPSGNGNGTTTISVDGTTIFSEGRSSYIDMYTFVVPAAATYSVSGGGKTIKRWVETY